MVVDSLTIVKKKARVPQRFLKKRRRESCILFVQVVLTHTQRKNLGDCQQCQLCGVRRIVSPQPPEFSIQLPDAIEPVNYIYDSENWRELSEHAWGLTPMSGSKGNGSAMRDSIIGPYFGRDYHTIAHVLCLPSKHKDIEPDPACYFETTKCFPRHPSIQRHTQRCILPCLYVDP
jgi:hypothetical protein